MVVISLYTQILKRWGKERINLKSPNRTSRKEKPLLKLKLKIQQTDYTAIKGR